MAKLGVNVDHVATLREARRENFPSPVEAAIICMKSGADGIVAHLREDRRHIKDKDIFAIRKAVKRFDMEMAATNEMQKIALKIKPDIVTLVPEKRQEVTTEGGLDVKTNVHYLSRFVRKLEDAGICVSLFIDPDFEQIDSSAFTGASYIEIHTGEFANAKNKSDINKKFRQIKLSVEYAKSIGLKVNAGHGLTFHNAGRIAKIPGVEELNIGFSIIADSVFSGLKEAVSRMKKAIC